MTRSAEAQQFHKQLIQKASANLEDKGYEPIQHVAIEGAGRPDLVGRTKEGKFEIIVECFVKQPSEKQLADLRKKYKKRKLVIVIPYGMEVARNFRKYFDELWEFPLTRDSSEVVPLGTIDLPRGTIDAIRTGSPQRRSAYDSMMGSHDVLTEYFLGELAKKKKSSGRPE